MQIHIKVFGRVQGVGYRSWAVFQARKLGLSGFVRNRRDRSVEIVAQGETQSINTFLEVCQKGPMMARVDKMEPQSYADAPLPSVETGMFNSVGTV